MRSVSVPPSGIASTALKIRLVSASRISLSTAMIGGQVRRQLGPQLDHDAALLRHVAPAGARQVDHLLHQRVQVHRRERQLRLALPIELAHARHGLRHVLDGALDGLQIARGRAALRFGSRLEQRLGVERDRARWRC